MKFYMPMFLSIGTNQYFYFVQNLFPFISNLEEKVSIL